VHPVQAWNDHPTQARIVLICDLWHPDLHKKEVKFLSFLQKGSMRRDKKVCERANEQKEKEKETQQARVVKEQGGVQQDATDEDLRDNFFDIIADARTLLPASAEDQQVWSL
jgi:aspartate beta-hydroxylase